MTASIRRIIVALSIVCALVACDVDDGSRFETPRLVELREPVLDRGDPAVRKELSRALANVQSLAEQPYVGPGVLGLAFGELGRLYHAYQFFAAAVPCYRNAEILLPDDFRWPYLLGRAQQSLNQPGAAAEAFDRALELKPTDAPTLVAMARLRRDAGDFDVAQRLVDELIDREPDNAAAMMLLAELAVDRGEPAEAVRWYERLLQQQPDATRIYRPLAISYRDLGDLERARALLARAGEGLVRLRDPLMNEVLSRGTGAKRFIDRGIAEFNQGNFQGAADAFQRAADADPELVVARVNLGAALVNLGRRDEAAEQFRVALELDPGHALAHFNLGVIVGDQGLFDESRAHYEAALSLNPAYSDARFNLANLLRRNGVCQSALEHYRMLLQTNPGNAGARLGELRCELEMGDSESILASLEAALAAFPNNALVAYTAARILAASPDDALRDGPRALDLAERLVSSNRSRANLETLAMAQAETGEFDSAVATMNEAIEIAEGQQGANLDSLHENLRRFENREPGRRPNL